MSNVPNLDQVKAYFDQRIQQHGASPRGSDWNSEASQNLRFDQLLKLVESQPFRFWIMAAATAPWQTTW